MANRKIIWLALKRHLFSDFIHFQVLEHLVHYAAVALDHRLPLANIVEHNVEHDASLGIEHKRVEHFQHAQILNVVGYQILEY